MDKGKLITYGSNIIVNPAVNLIKAGKYIGNPGNLYGGVFYGALDIASSLSPKIKKSTFSGLAKVVGMTAFGVKSVSDLVSVVNGNYHPAIDFVFDASMVLTLGKDVFEIYGGGKGKKDLVDDLKKLVPNRK